MNVLWLVLGGIFTAVEYVVASLLLMVTIVGIPFGMQTLKLAGLALWPFGKEVRTGERSGGCLYVLMRHLDCAVPPGVRGHPLHHRHRHTLRASALQAGGVGADAVREGYCGEGVMSFCHVGDTMK